MAQKIKMDAAMLNLIEKVIASRFWRYRDHDDLVSAGNEGLAKACATYDKASGFTFNAYAKACIANAMVDALRQAGCWSRNNGKPCVGSSPVTSDGNAITLIETYASSVDVEGEVTNRDFVAYHTRHLSEVEQAAVFLYYVQGFTYHEVAQELGLSANKAYRTVADALNKIKLSIKL